MSKKAYYVSYPIYLLVILSVVCFSAFGADPKDPEVKIIHFGAGNADCTLIIVKDQDKAQPNPGFHIVSTLIDTGIGPNKMNKMGRADDLWDQIWQRITDEKGDRLDYLIISHFDGDHVGNASRFLQIIQRKKYDSWRAQMIIIDRMAFMATGPSSDPKISQYKFWDRSNIGPLKWYNGTYSKSYGRRDGGPDPKNRKKRLELPPQRRLLFFGQDLFKFNESYQLANTQMICVASDGVIGDDRVALPRNNNNNKPRGENDLSFAFLLRFGTFRYYTGADIDDDPDETEMETALVKQLEGDWTSANPGRPFHVCAMKVNHHGSENGTKPDFVRYFNPRIAVFSAGYRTFGQSKKDKKKKNIHPSIDAITNLSGGTNPPSRQLLFTFVMKLKDRVKEADPMEKIADYKKWQNSGLQDVILQVRKEALVDNQPPRIYLSRLKRNNTYAPLPPEIQYAPASIDCDQGREHRLLPLPERSPLIPVKDQPTLQDLTQQLRLLPY